MTKNNKKYVKVYPQNSETGAFGFKSNVKPGDRLIYQASKTMGGLNLPRSVVVVSETPYHIRLDMGDYRLSVSKASIFCRDDVLYQMGGLTPSIES